MYDVQPCAHAGERHSELETEEQLGGKGQGKGRFYERMRGERQRLVPCWPPRQPSRNEDDVRYVAWVWERHSNDAATG